MIFSSFRKPKWQHKKSVVRIQAINELLDPTNKSQLSTLVYLLNNDPEPLVRRAVLHRINQFEQWLSASCNDNTEIAQFAEKQLLLMVNGNHKITINEAQKQQLLQREPQLSMQFLESWLATETDDTICCLIIDKLNKPNSILPLIAQKQIETVQLHLIKDIDDSALLEKIAKKSELQSVKNFVMDKMEAINEKREKPIKLRKKLQLNLSKLLALKDYVDYKTVHEKQQALNEEWQQLMAELDCLSETEQAEFTAKHKAISAQLEQLFSVKAEQYQQQLIAEKLAADKLAIANEMTQQLTLIKQQITTAVFEQASIDCNYFENQLKSLQSSLLESVLNDNEQAKFQRQINQQLNQLTNLPEIEQAVTEATHLISKMSQRSLPIDLVSLNEHYQDFQQWRQQWKAVQSKAGDVLPDSIIQAYKQIESQWFDALKPLQKEQRNKFNGVIKRINDVKRLIHAGKYNACFAIEKSIAADLPILSEQQLNKIQRDIDFITEKLADLSDWEHYVATPKKINLLNEMKALVEVPLDNPIEQANQVKKARKLWNSFGHADQDEQLNQQFNELCEQAFAPCRQFYAEQDKIRAQHLVVRQQLVSQAEQLAKDTDINNLNTSDSWKLLDTQLNQLLSKWHEAGEVDRHEYKRINTEFQTLLEPLKQALFNYYKRNSEAKQQLIELAEQAKNQAIETAIETVKNLQVQWKNIGYAGPRYENKLWHQFRKINDEIFNSRDKLKQQQIAMESELEQELTQKFSAIEKVVNAESSLEELLTNEQQLKDLLADIKNSDSKMSSLYKKITQLLDNIVTWRQKINEHAEQKNWRRIFNTIEFAVKENVPVNEAPCFKDLTKAWQKKLPTLMVDKPSKDREKATIEMEILAGIPSPEIVQQQRMAIQVELMQQKLNSGVDVSLQEKFCDWLQLGKLNHEEAPLLARVKTIFC